jgi:proteasome activator subunit 4
LGISAIIKTYPYYIPDLLPEILIYLASFKTDIPHFKEIIKKTFSEFQKTHSDNWNLDKKKFNDNQLSILNDVLTTQSYFA